MWEYHCYKLTQGYKVIISKTGLGNVSEVNLGLLRANIIKWCKEHAAANNVKAYITFY